MGLRAGRGKGGVAIFPPTVKLPIKTIKSQRSAWQGDKDEDKTDAGASSRKQLINLLFAITIRPQQQQQK